MYKKKSKKGKKKKCLGGEYRYSKTTKAFGGLTSSQMERLCDRVKIQKQRYNVIYTVY